MIRSQFTQLIGRSRPTPLLLGAALLLFGFACSAKQVAPSELPAAPQGAAPDGEDIRRDGALVLDGIPEVPADLRGRVDRYLNTRSAWPSDITDDGSKVLITTRFGDTTQLHLLSMPGGARTQLTFGDEPVRGASFVPGTQSTVSFLADVGGNENYQVVLLDPATGLRTVITDGEHRHGSPIWSNDGALLAYNGNARNGKDMDIYVSESGSNPRLLVEADGYWSPMEFSPDGSKLLVGHYVSIAESNVWMVDVATGELSRVTPQEPKASYRDAVFSHDGSRIFITTDKEGEFVSLYAIESDGSWTPLTADIPWDIEGVTVSPDGSALAVSVNEDGWRSPMLLNPADGKLIGNMGLERVLTYSMGFAKKAPVLVFTLTGPDRTGDVYTYDLSAEKLTRWTFSELGGLDASTFVQPELIRYPSFDGLEIPCWVYKPPGDGPFPVVINIHGGPEGQSRPWFSADTQYMVNEAGLAVLVPNVRGSSGYGKTWLGLDNGFAREDSVKDIGALLDWVEAQPTLDASRIAVSGGSYGGYMVLASLVHFGDRIKAGVDVVGISDFVTFLENTKEYRRDLRRAEYGDERDPAMREHLKTISPLTNVDKISSALFVAHGANDPRVPVGEAEQIVAAVRNQGHPVWYLLAENEGHGFSKKENRDEYRLLRFLFFAEQLAE